MGTEMEPTALFDYPTIESLSKYLANLVESEVSPHLSTTRARRSDGSSSHWILYSEIQVTENVAVPPASKLARRIVVVFAFPFSGMKKCLSYFSTHSYLFVCEDLCLLPFTTLKERKMVVSKDAGRDGLTNAIKVLRNCSVHSEAN